MADPCRGHTCDQCSRCRRGRCCRRDQPGYRLPELGEVTPVFGELGVLAVDDEERVQCHACSRFFRTLNSHIQRVHELTADEYRAAFGLNRGTALAAPAYRSRMREHGRRVLAPYWPLAADFARSQTPEQRAAQRGMRRRLQTLRDPIFRETQRRAGQASAARNHARFLAGVWPPPRPRDPSAAGRAAQRRRQELAQDPVYRAWLSRRLSEGQGGRAPVACATCGRIFELPRARTQLGARRYCSRDCLRAAQVERGRALGRATPTLMRRMDRACRICRRTFTGTVRQVYCSAACKSLADHRGASGTCAVCGRPFAGEDGQQYCSRTCAIRARSAERPGARGLGYTAIAARLRALSSDAFVAPTRLNGTWFVSTTAWM